MDTKLCNIPLKFYIPMASIITLWDHNWKVQKKITILGNKN